MVRVALDQWNESWACFLPNFDLWRAFMYLSRKSSALDGVFGGEYGNRSANGVDRTIQRHLVRHPFNTCDFLYHGNDDPEDAPVRMGRR